MKIIFICGSLQPGKDGVGDYTRRLAGQLRRDGHEVKIIALNDKKIETGGAEDQYDGDTAIPVLRLSQSQPWDARMLAAKKYIVDFNPDWLSLQYVPFSFQDKGLPWQLGSRLAAIGQGIKWNIMFHELWCGMNVAAPVKERILGGGQKLVLKKTVSALKPQQIFTSIESYSSRLINFGVKPVKVIPIFGNIAVDEWASPEDWSKFIEERQLQPFVNPDKAVIIIGFFGAVYTCPGLEEMLSNTVVAAKQLGKTITVFFIGHGDRTGIIKHLENAVPGIKFVNTGPLEPKILNNVLAIIDAGIITTPADGINKSGSAIAWIERGVPVLISGKDTSYNAADLEKYGVFQVMSDKDVIKAIDAGKNKKVKSRLVTVASFYNENLK